MSQMDEQSQSLAAILEKINQLAEKVGCTSNDDYTIPMDGAATRSQGSACCPICNSCEPCDCNPCDCEPCGNPCSCQSTRGVAMADVARAIETLTKATADK